MSQRSHLDVTRCFDCFTASLQVICYAVVCCVGESYYYQATTRNNNLFYSINLFIYSLETHLKLKYKNYVFSSLKFYIGIYFPYNEFIILGMDHLIFFGGERGLEELVSVRIFFMLPNGVGKFSFIKVLPDFVSL